MDELRYKLESADPVLIAHAVSKLFGFIKKKICAQETDHISKIDDFKSLLAKKDSADLTLSLSVCQALVALVQDGLWNITDALSTFTSSVSSMKNYTVAATTVSQLLILDMTYNNANENMYPFKLNAPQHPFIILLSQDKRSWQSVLSQMTFIVNHKNLRISQNSMKTLRPVFLYILCNPSIDSMDFCMDRTWQLLINVKHSIDLQREVLLWLCTDESHSCINTNYRILELTKIALAEEEMEYCTALLPMIASLTAKLLKHGSDPSANFDLMMNTINCCDPTIGNLMLTLLSNILIICPPMYLYKVLQICITIMKKMQHTNIFVNIVKTCVLKWLAYPSVLCSDALDMAKNFAITDFTENECLNWYEEISSNKLFIVFASSDPDIQFYTELVRGMSVWKMNDILEWLKAMSRVSIDLKDKCKLLISGLFLQTCDPNVTELCCNILVDISKQRKGFASHVLSLVLHKLTKSRNNKESKYLLLVIPELAFVKENVPVIAHTLDTLLTGDKQLKYFTIQLYLKAMEREPRCYRFVSTAIVRLMRSDASWYSDATCASTMKYICEHYPEHGEKLVPLLSQIINRSTDRNGGAATALALGCISVLYKASVIDICSTWKVLAPKMEKESRTAVLISLCELFADIGTYQPSQYSEEYDHLINDIVSQLWKYATCNIVKVMESAFKALTAYRLEQLILKLLPEEFRRDLVLPATYAKTAIDTSKKPEDVLPYIPGICWIQMLHNVNKAILTAAGNLLISFVHEEVSGFRSGIYSWPQGEPQNFKYLPEKSVIRAVGEFLRRCNKTDSGNHSIIIECLRIFAHRYPAPLPNVNWEFLNDIMAISTEAKQYTFTIVCRHAIISSSAKSFIENYLIAHKSIKESDIVWNNDEHSVLYENLEYLCQALQPNTIKPFLETTLGYVIEKMNLDNEEAVQNFNSIMISYARALKHQDTHDVNSMLISNILEKLFDKINLSCLRFHSYLTAALELSTKYLERITSPKVWWEISDSKLINTIVIRSELASKRLSFECPLMWLTEIMEETAVSNPRVQTYFLEIVQKVQTEMQFEKSTSKWILDLMAQLQSFLMESTKDNTDRLRFYCDVFFVSTVSLSGLDYVLMQRDQLIKVPNVRTKLFPQALTILSNRQDWKHVIPQLMEWFNYMRTSTLSSIYKDVFHESLICLRHNAYYKDVWTKYLSIQTNINL